RAWWAFAGTFIALVAIVIIQLLSGAADPIELLVGGLVLGVGVAAIEHRAAVADLEAGRRSEAESFVRILSNLSRSVSPDAVVVDPVRPQGDVQRVAERIAARTRTVYGLTNTLAAPLTVDGAAIGAIVLSHRKAGAWSPVTQRILGAAAVEASAALARVTSQR